MPNGFRKIWTLNDKTKVLVSLVVQAADWDCNSSSNTLKAEMSHLEDLGGIRQHKVGGVGMVFMVSRVHSPLTGMLEAPG